MQPNIMSKKILQLVISSVTLVLALGQTAFSYQGEKADLEVMKDHQLTQTAFTYQGLLINASGPANGIYDLQFILYLAPTEGDELSSIVYEDLVLTNGLFSVQLDFGSAMNSHESWLEVAVRSGDSTDAYTVLSPRQRLTATPYAILAQQEPWSLISVPVGIAGGVDVVKTIDAVKDDEIPAVGINAAPAQGIGSFIARFNAFGVPILESIMFDDGSNIGIGTTSPAAKLDVIGSLRTSANASFLGNVGIGTTSPAAKLDVRGSLRASGNTSLLGNVGIGTTSPAAKLDVRGSAGANGGAVFSKGISGPTRTFAALQVEQGQGLGEAGWLRTASTSNTSPVLKVIRHPNGSNNFMEGTVSAGPGSPEFLRFRIDGRGTFRGGSDFAEALLAKGGKAGYEPGDVLILSADQPGAVQKADRPYDVSVAGVYSTRPAVLGADKDGETRVDPDEIPVAIVGIVPTKVTTENGSIQPGDLLTTSRTPGHAMKASPLIVNGIELYPTGAIVGKALEPLENGTGVIKVLVMLR